jgi:hypothetical protein
MMTMAQRVTIGQRWRKKRDGQRLRITQVHRKDREVEARLDESPRRVRVSFDDLRRYWREEDPGA